MANAPGNSDAATGTVKANSYEYLEKYEQITRDSNGKKSHILMQIVSTQSKKSKSLKSATLARNLKWHIELKHLTSLEKYLQMNDDQK